MTHSDALFFFGTLRHPDILKIVLGRPEGRFRSAYLPDYRVARCGTLELPGLCPSQGRRAEGILAEGLTSEEIARLDFYEAGFDYELDDVTVVAEGEEVLTRAYFVPGVEAGDADWDFDKWVRDWIDMTRLAAREAMGHFGQIDGTDLLWRFPQIRTRAASAVRAAQRPSPKATFDIDDVEIEARHRPYDRFFAMDELELRHSQYSGGMGPPITRAVMIAADAVTVLPYDPIRDRVLVIEQFRAGPVARGDTSPWMVEAVAGRMDPGESPEDTARREAREEAGIDLGRLEEIGRYYPSPGAMSEYLFSFVGLCDLPDDAGIIAGEDSEHEDILGRVISFDALQEMVATGQAANGPLILSALWLAQNRDRLRRDD